MIIFTIIGVITVLVLIGAGLIQYGKNKAEGSTSQNNKSQSSLIILREVNKRKWQAIASESEITPYLKMVVEDFYIRDRINYETYLENQRANETTKELGSGLNIWEKSNQLKMMPEQPINCSPSFRKHYSEDRFNRGNLVPTWFYIAYPDIAFWFHDNLNLFENEIETREAELFDEEGKMRPLFFREVIEKYKNLKGKIECAL